MEIKWSEPAQKDLENFLDFYFEKDISFCEKWVNDLEEKLEHLKTFPDMGSLHSLLTEEFRMILIDPAILIYEIIDKKIYILGLHHQYQNFLSNY